MSCNEILQKTIDYCEANLDCEISLEELASRAGYSLFHFCRLFQSVTGHTPGEYMRKRRLSQAAMDLFNTNGYVRDIGYKWGFNSHENFVRAFKKQFGVSPSQYRNAKSSLNIFHRIKNLESRYCEDLGLTPQFVERPSFKLAGFPCHTTWEGNANATDAPKHWNKYHACRLYERIGREINPSSRFDIGMLTGYDFDKGTFTYIIGVEVDNFDGINDECMKITVPPAHYAVFKTPPADTETFVKTIHATWNYVYQVWMPQTGFRHTGTHEFDRYCEASRTFSEEIWIPVTR